jgi:nucleoside-diphosphate-sugar epimerase
LVLAAFERTRGNYQVLYKPARPGEQRHAEADIAKARMVLRWQPRVTFDEGMIKTVRWAAQEGDGVGVQGR